MTKQRENTKTHSKKIKRPSSAGAATNREFQIAQPQQKRKESLVLLQPATTTASNKDEAFTEIVQQTMAQIAQAPDSKTIRSSLVSLITAVDAHFTSATQRAFVNLKQGNKELQHKMDNMEKEKASNLRMSLIFEIARLKTRKRSAKKVASRFSIQSTRDGPCVCQAGETHWHVARHPSFTGSHKRIATKRDWTVPRSCSRVTSKQTGHLVNKFFYSRPSCFINLAKYSTFSTLPFSEYRFINIRYVCTSLGICSCNMR